MLRAVALASVRDNEVQPREAAERAEPLAELEQIAREGQRTLVHVRGAASSLEAVARHVERCARDAGRKVVRVAGLPTDDPWRELASRVGTQGSSTAPLARALINDPLAAASVIAQAGAGSVLVVVDDRRTQWGRAAADEIARVLSGEGEGPVVVSLSAAPPPSGSTAHVIELGDVCPRDVKSFWRALVADAAPPASIERLEHVESWWLAAQRTPADEPCEPELLSVAARRLLGRLRLSQRGWSLAQVSRLGPASARDELVHKGLFSVDGSGRLVATGAPMPVIETDTTDAVDVACALEATWPAETWAAARASELFGIAGDFDRAEAAASRAIGALTDADARADFGDRWEATLANAPTVDAAPRLRRSAELALRVGDVERALGFARSLVSRDDSCDALVTLGRATGVRGDLTTAAIVLDKALAKATDAATRARASVEIAEVRYTMGEIDAARAHAESAFADAPDLTTRLTARNVLGKLLLARGAWIEAERHFATDACDAACQGDVTCELRARLNRAIALLSSGRRDEARAMLNEVLVEGERAGEPRAVSFALQNLATIAILKHEYTDALRLAEQAIDVCRGVGEKIALARLIANLAELRLRLGLVAEADQALAFGRKACGPSIPASRAAHFALVAARVRLARGNTLEAAAEVAAALAAVGASSDGAKLGECYRIAARIALEDGDLARMAHALEKARAAANSIGAKAEVTLLEAHRARAAGEPYLEIGLEALELVRSADDGDLAREAHTLLARARFDADDSAAARAHVAAALALQACVADALPEELRVRFLARRELAELARLAAHGDDHDGSGVAGRDDARHGDGREPSSDVRRSVRPSARPEAQARTIVGKDPAIVALLAAVQKIGPSDATVLVHGESGTGKELVADAIHRASDRRHGPLVKVNCSALVETLLLSELFGHEKGSFTGAAARRRGRFEMAEGGTLFLDEIGDISARTQVALLRVLQEKTFERVGGVTQIQADVRIVCATHRDLKAMVARGEFREDLYYRLRGVVLEVPALRSRLGDLSAIAESILARVASERGVPVKRIAQGALAALKAHTWPGNVRELDNALRAAALFADGDVLTTDDFSNNVESLRDLVAPVTLSSPAGIGAASVAPEMTFSDAPPSTREQGGASTTEMAYAHVRSGVSLSDMKRLIEEECIERALAEVGREHHPRCDVARHEAAEAFTAGQAVRLRRRRCRRGGHVIMGGRRFALLGVAIALACSAFGCVGESTRTPATTRRSRPCRATSTATWWWVTSRTQRAKKSPRPARKTRIPSRARGSPAGTPAAATRRRARCPVSLAIRSTRCSPTRPRSTATATTPRRRSNSDPPPPAEAVSRSEPS